jgi:hypothetical protein
MLSLQAIAAISGMLLGAAAFLLSIFNYMRDRAYVKVYQEWDVTRPDYSEPYSVIFVTNTGRRPMFIIHVALELPPDSDERYLRLDATGEGKRLGEGDPPMACGMTYDKVRPYSSAWKQIRACACDSTGRIHYAKKPKKSAQTPSWVSGKSATNT